MYAGMVDIATLENDTRYRNAVEMIWNDVVSRKMYVTGRSARATTASNSARRSSCPTLPQAAGRSPPFTGG
jgi:DUF1680 family protein